MSFEEFPHALQILERAYDVEHNMRGKTTLHIRATRMIIWCFSCQTKINKRRQTQQQKTLQFVNCLIAFSYKTNSKVLRPKPCSQVITTLVAEIGHTSDRRRHHFLFEPDLLQIVGRQHLTKRQLQIRYVYRYRRHVFLMHLH